MPRILSLNSLLVDDIYGRLPTVYIMKILFFELFVYCIADLEDNISFLESEQGRAFLTVFRHLRLQYIVSDLASARIIERDNLIPTGKNVCYLLSAFLTGTQG